MNLAEFNALAVGDRVENAMTNGAGTVTKVAELRSGRVVSVNWGGHPPHGNIKFDYPVQSTGWYHWNKVDNSLTKPGDTGSPL